MRINNNMMAMNTHRQLGIANTAGSKSMEKLSSGYKINRAGDDAAGLAISEKMRGQIRGLNMASKNAQDGISLIQTTEGALNETHAILQRMRELAVQSASDTNTGVDRSTIQDEIDQLSAEITRIAETTEFNTMSLLDGSFSGKKFQIGANDSQSITFEVNDMTSTGLKLDSKVLSEVFETGDINGSNITVYGKDGKAVDIEFVRQTGTNVPTVSTTSGKTTVTFGASGITLDNLKAGLLASGMVVEVADGTKAIDFSKLSGQKVTAGQFTGELSQAKVSVGGLDFTVKNSAIKSISIVRSDANLAATSAKIVDGNVTINLGKDASGLSGTALHGNIKTAITAAATSGLTGVTLSDISAGFGSSNIKEGTVGNIQLKEERTGLSKYLEGASLGKLDVSTQAKASKSVTTINNALETVSKERSKLGAIQNRLEHTIKNLDTSAENLQASESRIRDVDMAKEMMVHTKFNILQQASTAMLAQANQAPQTVLSLLR